MGSNDEVMTQEVGAECAEAPELAQLSEIHLNLDDLEQLLALSDADLETLTDGHTVGPLSLDSFLAPGGGWNGSEAPARRSIPVGTRNGLVVTSLKRSSGNTGSDHHVSQRSSFAVDMSNGTRPTPQMLRTAQLIAAALGYRWPANGYINTSTTSRGYRAQLIYNSSVVPNHANHVHFGVRKER